jgi:carboxymethylenebutenolidase
VTPSDGLLAKDLTIPTTEPYYQIPAYIAMPLKANKSPVILVVPEIFGLHDYIRDVCRRLANTGYVALSFDPFARAGNAASLNDMDKLRPLVETATNDMVMGDLKTLIKWLKSKPDIGQDKNILRRKVVFADTTKIGITGFCWGGAVAWMAAANIAEIKAGVAWYGRLERPDKTEFLGKDVRPWPIDIASNLSKPVLGLYADQDRGISLESVARMNQALKASGKTRSFIKVFKGAKHAFHADYRPSYKADAAKEGWMDMLI